MVYPDFRAGQRLTAELLRGMQWQSVEQGSAQTVNNSATLVDTNLSVTLPASSTWMFRLFVAYTTSDTGDDSDLRFAWSVPPNGTVARWTQGYGANGSGGTNDFTSVNFRRPATDTNVRIGASGSGDTNSYYEWGVFLAGDGGAFVLQFAQWSATSVDTSVTASSRLDYLRIG